MLPLSQKPAALLRGASALRLAFTRVATTLPKPFTWGPTPPDTYITDENVDNISYLIKQAQLGKPVNWLDFTPKERRLFMQYLVNSTKDTGRQ